MMALPVRVTLFQSTPPHGERLAMRLITLANLLVSIHAPARGATVNSSVVKALVEVSIHAPARGATGVSFGG